MQMELMTLIKILDDTMYPYKSLQNGMVGGFQNGGWYQRFQMQTDVVLRKQQQNKVQCAWQLPQTLGDLELKVNQSRGTSTYWIFVFHSFEYILGSVPPSAGPTRSSAK
jgi:hypothetical protein